MNKLMIFLVLAFSLCCVSQAVAGTCEINITTTACPGKDKAAYKKCGGEASCTKTKKKPSEEECAVYAVKKCINRRNEVTKIRVLTAKFDGKTLKTSEGNEDLCSEDNEEAGYIVSKNYPFKDKTECS